jgi:hypothetical protein
MWGTDVLVSRRATGLQGLTSLAGRSCHASLTRSLAAFGWPRAPRATAHAPRAAMRPLRPRRMMNSRGRMSCLGRDPDLPHHTRAPLHRSGDIQLTSAQGRGSSIKTIACTGLSSQIQSRRSGNPCSAHDPSPNEALHRMLPRISSRESHTARFHTVPGSSAAVSSAPPLGPLCLRPSTFALRISASGLCARSRDSRNDARETERSPRARWCLQ